MRVLEKELDDMGREGREVEIARPDEAGAVDAGEEPLVAQPLDGMRCASTDVVHVRLDQFAYLCEQVDHRLVIDPGQRILVLSRVEGSEEAEIDRSEVERRAAVVQ